MHLDDGDQLPVPLVQTTPIYPFELRKAGISGYAVIGFVVDRDGNVRDAYVIKATHEAFGQMALACVSNWKFEPGRKAGRLVNVRMSVPIRFDLSPPPKPAAPAPGSS